MRFFSLLAGALALASCDVASAPFACTEEFVWITVEVVDSAGRPVEGLTPTSVNERTGEPLAVPEGTTGTPEAGAAGFYIVATDADARGLRVDGDPVLFTAVGDAYQASARFVLADDGCHIVKEEGPERLTASPR